MVGTNFSQTTGRTNAILSLSETMANKNQLYLFSMYPLIGDDNFLEKKANIRVIKKYFSGNLLFKGISNFFDWTHLIGPFLNISINNLGYFGVTLYFRVFFKEILHSINPDIVHIHGATIDYFPIIKACLDSNTPFVITAHGIYSLDENVSTHYKKSIERRIFEESAARNQIITAVSQRTKDDMLANFHGLHDKEIRVINNGVNSARYSSCKLPINTIREKFHIPEDRKVFVQVGSLIKRKNHIQILEALLEMMPEDRCNIFYLIVGKGPEKNELESFIERNNLSAEALLIDDASDDELIELYHASDFFILPSTSEGLPLVFIEALAAGLPVITFKDMEGITDIYHEDYFELIPERTDDQTANTMISAINRSWDRNEIMDYAKKFDWDIICEQYYHCYDEIEKTNLN